MGQLGDWEKKNSKIIRIEDGETLQAVYKGFKIGANPYDTEKEMVFYKLEIVQEGEKVTKIFRSASGKAARFFDPLNPGTAVKISRQGEGNQTKYDFDVLVEGAQALNPFPKHEKLPADHPDFDPVKDL